MRTPTTALLLVAIVANAYAQPVLQPVDCHGYIHHTDGSWTSRGGRITTPEKEFVDLPPGRPITPSSPGVSHEIARQLDADCQKK